MERIVPALLLLLPWLIAVFEIRRGLTRGELREYLRRDASELNQDRPAKFCKRTREPRTFWCLFAFYLAICILVPVGLIYVFTRPE